MLNRERDDEVWLSSFLPMEEKIANYPLMANAKDDDALLLVNRKMSSETSDQLLIS